MLAGGYVAWYGVCELRLYAGGSAEDPVVTAASGIQNALAGWVDRLGPAPFALALLALVALACVATLLTRRRTCSRTAPDRGGPVDPVDPPDPVGPGASTVVGRPASPDGRTSR